jgi:hypothetical protein
MRNMRLVDAVIQLQTISKVVVEETENADLALAIRMCADALHKYSIAEGHASDVASEIIRQVKGL